jgi:Domain of unknown function (DUF397)
VADLQRADIVWRKSTASGAGNCVEVAFADESVLIRQSRDPSGPVLSVSHVEWIGFLNSMRDGRLDLPQSS